jgi:hypothetical protein
VALEVVTESVEDPEVTSEIGLKVAVVPEGSPLTLNETFPLNPFNAETLTV